MASIAHTGHIAPGRMAYYPTDVIDWTCTDLDADVLDQAERLGYSWDHATQHQGHWEHIFGYTWQTLAIRTPINIAALRHWLDSLDAHYVFEAELTQLGWRFSARNHNEWEELVRCRAAGGDIGALVRSFQERAAQERERAALWDQYTKVCRASDLTVAVVRSSSSAPATLAQQIAHLRESIAAVETYQIQMQAEEVQRIIRNIKRWAKQKLSRNEMVRRMGGDRNAALKLIRVVLFQADAR